MSYNEQTWQTGNVISAEKLNHMEDGIATGVLLGVNGTINGNTMTLDRTWQEINDAGAAVMWFENPETGATMVSWLTSIGMQSNTYACNFSARGGGAIAFYADSADGYPISTMGGSQEETPVGGLS